MSSIRLPTLYGESSGMRSKYIRSPGQGQMFEVDDKEPGRKKNDWAIRDKKIWKDTERPGSVRGLLSQTQRGFRSSRP